jgi:ATP synthase protein I
VGNKSNFSQNINKQALRKLRAQQKQANSVWSGLGMMGLIGWSIVLPTLLGAILGIWLDKHYSRPQSWTLSLLVIGLIIGCANAWHWVSGEDKAMHQKDNDDN